MIHGRDLVGAEFLKIFSVFQSLDLSGVIKNNLNAKEFIENCNILNH